MKTLAAMRAVAQDASVNSRRVQALAARIAAVSPHKNFGRQIERLWAFLRETVRYKGDPLGTDQITHPDNLLAEISDHGTTAADCDDLATLAAAVLRALGMQPVFIVVGRGHRLEHVLPGVRFRGRVIPLDAQEGLAPGTWPPQATRIEIVEA